MKFLFLFTFILIFSKSMAIQRVSDSYPIIKFKAEMVNLYDYDDPKKIPERIKMTQLGDPRSIRVYDLVGASREHLKIKYENKMVTFSKSKVELDQSFDKRISNTEICIKETNQTSKKKSRETTSICER